MYETPSIGLLTTQGEAGFGNVVGSFVVNAHTAANVLAVVNAVVYTNAAVATLAVAAGAFLWIAGAITFNSGILPQRE